MLSQVNDFAIVCNSEQTANYYWDQLDKYLKEPLKRGIGLLKRHNEIDINQTEFGIKLHCKTYLLKILERKTFSLSVTENKPIPMLSENSHMRELESTKGSQDPIVQQ